MSPRPHRMALSTEYAMMAINVAGHFSDADARANEMAHARSLPQLRDEDVGFLKARTASFIRSVILNSGMVAPEHHGELCACLREAGKFLLILPDMPGGQPRTRASRPAMRHDDAPPRPVRYRPGVDD